MHGKNSAVKYSFYLLIGLFITFSFIVSPILAAPESIWASSFQNNTDLDPLAIEQGSVVNYFILGQTELNFKLNAKSPRTDVHYYWTLQHTPAFGRAMIQSMGSQAKVTYIPTTNASGNDFFNLLLTTSTGESASTTINITVSKQPGVANLRKQMISGYEIGHTTSERPAKDRVLWQMPQENPVIQKNRGVPHFGVYYSANYIQGFHFTPNDDVTLSILDDEWTVQSDGEGYFYFQQDDIEVSPGQTVIISDSVNEISHRVFDLKVIEINKDTKTVTGTSDSATDHITVSAPNNEENDCYRTGIFGDVPGAWTADFSTCAPAVTFEHGTEGWAFQYDENGNFTQEPWDIREPFVGANYSTNFNNIEGFNFSPENWITLKLMGDPWERLQEWADENGFVSFYIDSFAILPGQTFVLEDSKNNRVEYTVSDLSVLEIDEAAKTVTGTSDGEIGELEVSAFDGENECYQWASPVIGEPDVWTADFSECDPAIAFEPLTDGWAFQYDDDGNFTQKYWKIPAPQIGVFHSADFLAADGWPPNAEVTLKIGSFRWETTADDKGTVSFHLDPFNVQPGQTITVTDGDQTQSYVVSNLTVIDIDDTNHIVSGSKSPNLPLVVTGGGDGSECYYDLGSDDSDHWEVDFSECIEITPGTFGWAFQYDHRRHHFTQEFWIVPAPTIGVFPAANYIQGTDWTPNTETTLSIEGHQWKVKSEKEGEVYFHLDHFDVLPGQEVTITDGIYNQSYVVADISVTGFNEVTETVSGIKSPNQPIVVTAEFDGAECWKGIDADGSSNWVVDFSDCDPEVDISPSASGWATQYDEIGNLTQDYWFVPAPSLIAYPLSDLIIGHQWPPITEITLSINGTDWQGVSVSNHEGRVYFYTSPFDVQPGQEIRMEDGQHSMVHVIKNLDLSSIDLDTNSLYGLAAPDEQVFLIGTSVGIPEEMLMVPVDSSGNWEAEFTELNPGSYGYAWQNDAAGNATSINWHVPAPSIDVFIETGIITGALWSQNANMTLRINEDMWHAQSDAFGYVFFDITPFELLPEHMIEMSDGTNTIEYQPWEITVTDIDTENDVISGTAQFTGGGGRTDPHNEVEVRACNTDGCLSQYLTLDGSGYWEANFSGVLNIGPGNSGHIKSEEDEKKSTKVNWTIADQDPDLDQMVFLPLFIK